MFAQNSRTLFQRTLCASLKQSKVQPFESGLWTRKTQGLPHNAREHQDEFVFTHQLVTRGIRETSFLANP